jgi:hypothetical protein
MKVKCQICRTTQSKGQTHGDKWICDDCVEWAEGRRPRKDPGGFPPRSGLAFFERAKREQA